MTKNLIITISIGNRPWFRKTKLTIINYCNRYDIDFKVITGQYDTDKKIRLRKFEIVKYFNEYDRILFLDDTIIINPISPDLFKLVPYDKVGVLFEKEPFYNKINILKSALKYYEINANVSNNNYIWFNSGVILASKCHLNLFEIPNKNIIKIGNYLDQSIFNINRYKYNIPAYDIGLSFNYLGTRISEGIPYKIDDIDNIYFYHVTRAFRNSQRKKIIKKILNILAFKVHG
jgi:hypothetical protein